ncbi:hypothetical protein [Alteribacter keqinensis]|uniref:Uncharacterized protein n=1 Tax=Alteribacter keqinensis TaxID=2483800 RepID=A0A3M7TN58_9BACI|nr:hypothetical protein [Alteribacter keqinensis]RNA66892.1 hypothetical protein EBO34_16955 [Alteribacter keqinensis]
MPIAMSLLILIGVTIPALALVFQKGDDTRKKNVLKMLFPAAIIILLYLPSALINQEPPGYVQVIGLAAVLSMLLLKKHRLFVFTSTAALLALGGYYFFDVL